MILAYSIIASQRTIITCDCEGRCNCRGDARAPRWANTRYRWNTVTRQRIGIIHTGEDWTAPAKRGDHYLGCHATDPIEQHRSNCPCRYTLESAEQVNALTAIALGIHRQPLSPLETISVIERLTTNKHLSVQES